MNPILRVVIFSVSSFLFLFIVTKIMGKKQIAQLSFLDYVIGISLGSIAAEMATDPERPFYHFFIAMTIYLVMDILLTLVARKGTFLKKFLRGRPLILVEEGRINYKNLTRSKLDINDHLSLCRAKGYFDLRDVRSVIFETSGDISVLPSPRAVNARAVDLGIRPLPASLSKDVVEDGRIVERALEEVGRDKSWLLSRLGIEEGDVAKIALVTYYKEDDELVVHRK